MERVCDRTSKERGSTRSNERCRSRLRRIQTTTARQGARMVALMAIVALAVGKSRGRDLPGSHNLLGKSDDSWPGIPDYPLPIKRDDCK